MPFTVASIKDKATHVKNASVSKYQDTRDKYSSAPMAKTKFAEDGIGIGSKPPPPPPPPPRGTGASSYNTSSSPLPQRGSEPPPPPIARGTKPVSQKATGISHFQRPSVSSANKLSSEDDRIDWANLSPGDKEEFFRWLDEFFSRYLGIPVGPPPSSLEHQHVGQGNLSSGVGSSEASIRPPPVKSWSKPKIRT